MRIRATILLLASALAMASPRAQSQTPPARASGAVQAQTTAVLVDVVVRDKRGQPVTDLAPADFEILEDGVPQEIGSVTLYTPSATARDRFEALRRANAPANLPSPPPAAAEPGAPAPRHVEPPPVPVVALVFDRLAPEARAFAHQAALAYVGDAGQSQSLIGVFGIDLSLITYQNYTREASRLRKAIADVGVRSTAQFESQAARAREAGQRAAGAGSAAGAMAAGGQAAGQAAQAGGGAAAADAMMAQMQQRTLETFEVLERDQQGYSTTNALLAVVNGMRALPGRKSVIFFSEGVAIPANVAARFRSVIDTANRANVSIYAMDAAGLRAESTSKEARDAIMAAAENTLRRDPTADVVGTPMTAALERNEDMLRHDPHSGLGQLADETGGVLIRNTNDLTGGFRRIDQDMRNYYMLSYVPKNDTFDGKFRTITVNVKRSGVEIAARKGYYAVRAAGPMPVMSFEAPALALLEATPVPNAFPVRAAAMRFPEEERLGLTPVLVSVPGSVLTFRDSEDGASYKADFTVVVRFRNAANEIVDKMSQNYVLTGPKERLDSVKQGNVLFYREPELEPGVYTMEAVVHDAFADKASVRFVTVEQARVEDDALRASTLVLVGSAERLAEADRPVENPFLVGDTLLYPNLGEPLRKSTTQELGFFFTLYPAKQSKPEAVIELVQNGSALARLPLQLGQPDGSGRIQQVSRLPIGALAAGTYDLRVIVSQGQHRVARSAVFRIVD
jgi:VWFA-related protein